MAVLKKLQNRDIPCNSGEEQERGHYNSKSINQFGLLSIGVAAITISLIFLLFYRYENKTGEKQLVKDGVTLCSLVADLVSHTLLGEDKFRNLNLLDYVVREKGLEYCLVIDNKGVPLIRLGRQIPEGDHKPGEKNGKPDQSAAIDSSPVMESIMTQKRLKNQDGEVVYEFSRPIYLEGDRTGLLKIGLALSNYIHFTQEGMYLAACIALSIFGLGFLFYYLLKRLFSPLNQINYHLRQMIKEDMEFPKIELPGKAQVPHLFQGEIGQLTQGMNQLLLHQQKKNQKWEEFNAELEISNKILIYEKSRMKAILDNIKIGLVVIDSTGRTILANKLARHFLIKSPQPALEKGGGRGDGQTGRRADGEKEGGRGEEEQTYLGKPWKEFLYSQNQDLGRMFHTFYEKENIYAHDCFDVQSTEGGTLQVLCHCCSYLLDEEDKPLGFLWAITDITTQKQSESARHDFVNHVAHELKTPLNTLLSYSEMLLDGEVNDEQAKREFFNSINEEAARLSRLINNLLNISKIEMGSLKIDRTLIKVDKLIMDCFSTVRAQALSKGINFSIEVADKMPNLLLDKDLIEVAILNLLTNAIKYTPEQGKVVLQGIVEEEHVLIRVTDSGHGIPENEINHVFDKFFRSGKDEIRKEPGTGLGLSLAMNIIQLHKGDIRVESQWGTGSSFTIVLPKEEVYI